MAPATRSTAQPESLDETMQEPELPVCQNLGSGYGLPNVGRALGREYEYDDVATCTTMTINEWKSFDFKAMECSSSNSVGLRKAHRFRLINKFRILVVEFQQFSNQIFIAPMMLCIGIFEKKLRDTHRRGVEDPVV
jgi:hypothetical protein